VYCVVLCFLQSSRAQHTLQCTCNAALETDAHAQYQYHKRLTPRDQHGEIWSDLEFAILRKAGCDDEVVRLLVAESSSIALITHV